MLKVNGANIFVCSSLFRHSICFPLPILFVKNGIVSILLILVSCPSAVFRTIFESSTCVFVGQFFASFHQNYRQLVARRDISVFLSIVPRSCYLVVGDFIQVVDVKYFVSIRELERLRQGLFARFNTRSGGGRVVVAPPSCNTDGASI
jgi:hypothetical protein